METEKEIEKVLLKYPILEYAFGDEDQIPFSDKVLLICQSDCERYKKCWSCPPYCGTSKELRDRCANFSRLCMFSTVTFTENAWDEAEDLRVKINHEKITAEIKKELQKFLSDLLMLSTGCMLCESCTCPKSPCRFPEKRVSSIESYGIVAIELAEKLGLSTKFDADTIVYFSMVLF